MIKIAVIETAPICILIIALIINAIHPHGLPFGSLSWWLRFSMIQFSLSGYIDHLSLRHKVELYGLLWNIEDERKKAVKNIWQ
jgi:hypothetical protein